MLSDSAITSMLPVGELERARNFYELTLGLRLLRATQTEAWYECGRGTRLCLYKPPSPPGQNTIVSWEVMNIEREVKELKRKGVSFQDFDFPGVKTIDGIADFGMTKKAWFKDTEGNILAVTQRY
ncbi:MAG: VOC family protein [Chloroflexi bacterium]|nr:VOC family protein [Chloroflexota bacterium]